MKKCTKCQTVKELTEFSPSQSQCKPCRRIPANLRYRYEEHLMSRYSITEEQYQEILAAQNGKCAICGREEKRLTGSGKIARLSVDHDHKNGVIRGLLCVGCNSALGKMQDSTEVLIKAIKYLNHGMNLVFPYIAGAPNFNKWGPKAFELIRKERERQITLWSENDFEHHDDHKILTILTEELGEIARAILEHDNDNLLEEIIQLGALCSKWIEHILEKSAQKEESDTQLDLIPCSDYCSS